jgi:hypothetical protein
MLYTLLHLLFKFCEVKAKFIANIVVPTRRVDAFWQFNQNKGASAST